MMYQVCTCPQSNLTGGDPHCPIHGQPPTTQEKLTGCQCVCHKYPKHFPFDELQRLREAVEDIPALIRGHKSHWQEPLDKFERDQLLEGVAKHIEYWLKKPAALAALREKEADTGKEKL